MSFNLGLKYGEKELCDKCRKPGTELNPLADMWTSGRSYDQRNFIQVHVSCLTRMIRKETERVAEMAAQPKEQVASNA